MLGYVHPSLTVPLDGMKFSTRDMDYDTYGIMHCANFFGSGWWYNKCGAIILTSIYATWYSPPDNIWYDVRRARMMVKIQ